MTMLLNLYFPLLCTPPLSSYLSYENVMTRSFCFLDNLKTIVIVSETDCYHWKTICTYIAVLGQLPPTLILTLTLTGEHFSSVAIVRTPYIAFRKYYNQEKLKIVLNEEDQGQEQHSTKDAYKTTVVMIYRVYFRYTTWY